MNFFLPAVFAIFLSFSVLANPYFIQNRAPKDREFDFYPALVENAMRSHETPASNFNSFAGESVLRLQVDWNQDGRAETEDYVISGLTKERSGTPGLLSSRKNLPEWGSYRGVLKCGSETYYDSIGTGSAYRKLVRAMTFRFPFPTEDCAFELLVENPKTGISESVLKANVDSDRAEELRKIPVEVIPLKAARDSSKVFVTIYSEGYTLARKEEFLKAARKTIATLEGLPFPGVEHFEFTAVFSESAETLGEAKDLGKPIPEKKSFLGLYFPYWAKDIVERWYHVVYPTREAKFRDAIGQVPYDYPIVLVDDGSYWGIGNYKELTALPANNSSFSYLLLHEFGHYFGLNEEYDGGGPTELQFSPETEKPFSQNLLFSSKTDGSLKRDQVKWKELLFPNAPVPTSTAFWRQHYKSSANPFPVGAYLGGYADSEPQKRSYIPVIPGACIMHSAKKFCPVCEHGIQAVVDFDREI